MHVMLHGNRRGEANGHVNLGVEAGERVGKSGSVKCPRGRHVRFGVMKWKVGGETEAPLGKRWNEWVVGLGRRQQVPLC